MNDGSENLKAYFAPLARAMADFSEGPVRAAMDALFEEDAILRICHPFGELVGPNAFYKTAYAPLLKAMPDLERRELILLAGKTLEEQIVVCPCTREFILGVRSSPAPAKPYHVMILSVSLKAPWTVSIYLLP